VTARIVDVIARKRDGRELSADELRAAIAPGVPNYQLAAFLMAVVWRGLTPAETNALLDAMVDSGERLDLGDVGRPVADKHSTGGVGDKTTLVAAPLAVAAGAAVAKLSGAASATPAARSTSSNRSPVSGSSSRRPSCARRWRGSASRSRASRRRSCRPTAASTLSAT
jgi:anthranilate phosphoribosyltransferase